MRSWGSLTSAITIFLLSVSAGTAQEIRVGVLQVWPDHELLGSPRGVEVAVGVRLVDRIGVRLGFESSGDDVRGFGTTCMGLVAPNIDCADEARDEQARIRALTLATPFALMATERLRIHLVPGLRAARVRSLQVGLASQRARTADKTLYGAELGAELVLAIRRWPIQLHLSGYAGTLFPSIQERVADGYLPFEERFGLNRLQLGATLSR